MKTLEVRIEDEVYQDLVDFYDYNLEKHPTLDEVTVLKKEQRLINSGERVVVVYEACHELLFY